MMSFAITSTYTMMQLDSDYSSEGLGHKYHV